MRFSMQTVAAAALAAAGLVAGGCATTHVGDDWQCPVTQGVPCQSVVEADPARAETSHRESAVTAKDERSQRCSGGCRPFGWLRRALAGGNALADSNALAHGNDAMAGTEPSSGPEPESGEPHAGEAGNGDLRLPETVGRIWIAPYVDDEGIYHEAAWVRVVLRPARWKQP